MQLTKTALLTLALVGTLPAAWASGTAIGIIAARGEFQIEHSKVWGNATLFDGATVETGVASSQLALRNGVKVELASQSRAKIYSDRLILEKGFGHVTAPVKYQVDARGLRITSPDSHSELRVNLATARFVDVAALSGTLLIANSYGVLTSMAPGKALTFDPQAEGSAVSLSGCLLYKDGKLILQDEASGDVVELQGAYQSTQSGNRVQISGVILSAKPTVTIAKSVVNVDKMTLVAPGGCISVATKLDASTSVPTDALVKPGAVAQTKPGLSGGQKGAIIAFVAGGGAAGAAVALKGSKKTSTSP